MKSYSQKAVTLALAEGKAAFSGLAEHAATKTKLLPEGQVCLSGGQLTKKKAAATNFSG